MERIRSTCDRQLACTAVHEWLCSASAGGTQSVSFIRTKGACAFLWKHANITDWHTTFGCPRANCRPPPARGSISSLISPLGASPSKPPQNRPRPRPVAIARLVQHYLKARSGRP